MNEFTLIGKYFAPLAKSFPGSLNLSDDAAILDIPEGYQLVVTKDAIAQGIHYLPDTPPRLIAQKLLRTNLSDLASMGATPFCYFLAVALPTPLGESFIHDFAEGLAADQREFGIHLAGGDTVTTTGAPIFSVTAHGLVSKGNALTRSGAKPGDVLHVSGTLGDAALGLREAKAGRDNYLSGRYHLPQPRVKLGEELRGLATSCVDISDGLLADAGHIARHSGVAIEIDKEALPLSKETRAIVDTHPELSALIYSGGDDYELLFTLPENVKAPKGTTRIGRVKAGSGVSLMHEGSKVATTRTGYQH